jgi:hypothetical protein
MMAQAGRKEQGSSVALQLFSLNLFNRLQSNKEIFSSSVARQRKYQEVLGQRNPPNTVILSLFWRRTSRDFSDLLAAGAALSPECRFFGQNAATVQICLTHSGRSFAQRRAQDDRFLDVLSFQHHLLLEFFRNLLLCKSAFGVSIFNDLSFGSSDCALNG